MKYFWRSCGIFLYKYIREGSKCAGHISKMRGMLIQSKSNPDMCCSGKYRKSYACLLSGELQPTRLFHVPGNSSKHYKLLSNFGKRYSYGRSTKESKYEKFKGSINKKRSEYHDAKGSDAVTKIKYRQKDKW